MPSKIDQRRLRDGRDALNLPVPSSIQEMRDLLIVLGDAIRAMQSLDDLGSIEANEIAWNDMLELERREGLLRERLQAENAAQRSRVLPVPDLAICSNCGAETEEPICPLCGFTVAAVQVSLSGG